MRIALLNCYLQGGHTENAEIESAARFVAAAGRMGIEAKAFARSEDLSAFAPDFVLSLSYNDAKLADFPTYVLLTMPVRWIENLPRFLRNVLSYDGYWTIAPSVSRYVGALYEKAGKPDLGAFAAISYARTDFVPLDFTRASAAYLGTNWDGLRHGEAFRALAPLGVAKFYGKRDRWAHLPEQAWGGEVAFDGVSVINTYRAAGIGLCFNHPDFDAEGVPTSRIFEVPAASAVMIAGRNRLVEEMFGDAALYVDLDGTADSIAGAVRDHVEWVRANPGRAQAMAEASHRVFNERFALETMLANAVALHETARTRLGYRPPAAGNAFDATILVSVHDGTLRYLDRCLDSILRQSLAPRRVTVLDGTAGAKAGAPCMRMPAVEHRRVPRGAASLATALARAGRDIATEWVSAVSAEDILYPNHLFAAAETVRRHREKNCGGAPALVYSGMAEISETEELPELIDDGFNVMRAEHMRLAQFDFGLAWKPFARLPLHPSNCMLHVPSLGGLLRRRWLLRICPAALTARLGSRARDGSIAFTAAMTMATSSARWRQRFGKFTPP